MKELGPAPFSSLARGMTTPPTPVVLGPLRPRLGVRLGAWLTVRPVRGIRSVLPVLAVVGGERRPSAVEDDRQDGHGEHHHEDQRRGVAPRGSSDLCGHRILLGHDICLRGPSPASTNAAHAMPTSVTTGISQSQSSPAWNAKTENPAAAAAPTASPLRRTAAPSGTAMKARTSTSPTGPSSESVST